MLGIAVLSDRNPAGAVPITPACRDVACGMLHSREHRDFSPDHVAFGRLNICSDPAGRQRGRSLDLDGECGGVNLKRLRRRQHEGFVLPYDNLGWSVPPQERNAPSGE